MTGAQKWTVFGPTGLFHSLANPDCELSVAPSAAVVCARRWKVCRNWFWRVWRAWKEDRWRGWRRAVRIVEKVRAGMVKKEPAEVDWRRRKVERGAAMVFERNGKYTGYYLGAAQRGEWYEYNGLKGD